MASVSTINSTIFPHYTIEEPQNASYFTSAKIKQVALYFFATLLATGSVAAALLAPSPFGLLSIPMLFLSIGLTYMSYKIKDYDNPEKLKLYRQEAPLLTFQQLVDEHGLKNIMQYQILSPELVKEKFNRQVQTMDFNAVLNAYPAEELLGYQIATPEHVSLLRKLKVEGDKYRSQYQAYINELDIRYSGRTDVIKRKIQQGKGVADATAAMALGRNSRERADAYLTANAITTPLAFVGDIIAEEVGRDSQISYEHRLAKGRAKFHEKMSLLEEEYNDYKRRLI